MTTKLTEDEKQAERMEEAVRKAMSVIDAKVGVDWQESCIAVSKAEGVNALALWVAMFDPLKERGLL